MKKIKPVESYPRSPTRKAPPRPPHQKLDMYSNKKEVGSKSPEKSSPVNRRPPPPPPSQKPSTKPV